MSLGCGPEAADEPYVPRLCETEGPVSLLEVDSPPGAGWSVQPVGEHLVADWYANEDVAPRMGAHVVDPCGAGSVALPEDVVPYVVDHQLWGCDANLGTLARVDLETGIMSEPEPGTFDCTLRESFSNAVFLADGSQERLVLLDADGPHVLDVPLEPVTADPRDLPFYAGRWGVRHRSPVDAFVRHEAGELYRIEVAARSVTRLDDLPSSRYRVSGDMLLATDADLFAPGVHSSTLLDNDYREIGAGPSIEGPIEQVWGSMIVIDGQLFSILEGETYAAPRPLDDPGDFHLVGDWLAYIDREDGHHQVWDYRTGALVYALDHDTRVHGDPSFSSVDGQLEIERADGVAQRVVERVNPRTKGVDEVLRYPGDRHFHRFGSRQGALVFPGLAADGRRPLEYVDTTTFETTQLTPDADGIASTMSFEVLLGDDLFFFRHAGEGAGLWRTRVPD